MKRFCFRVFLPFVFVLLLLAPEVAWAETFGDVAVGVIPLYERHDPTRRGYAGYGFRVRNDGTEPCKVRIKIPANHRNQPWGLVSNSRTVTVSPGGSSEIWIYQPSIHVPGGGSAELTINGQAYTIPNVETNSHVGLDNYSHGYGGPGYGGPGFGTPSATKTTVEQKRFIDEPDPRMDTGENTAGSSDANATSLEKEAATPAAHSRSPDYMPGRGYSNDNSSMSILVSRGLSDSLRNQLTRYLGNCNLIRSANTAEWPASWLTYSQFDGVILTEDDFKKLDSEAVSALADYVSVGGAVWVRPTKGRRAKFTEPMKELQQAAASGMGVFLRNKNGSGFKDQAIANLQCGNAWENSTYTAKRLPAVERNVAPVRLFLVILVFYAIAIGPVLQFILKLKRRRIWMLWIIPVTAIILCGIVFAGSYLAEGFHGFANFRNITVLDQKAGRASTVGLASFYSPLSDGDGLRFSTATVLQPQWSEQGMGRMADMHEVAMDWSHGQHLTTGWLQAKTPIVFRLWKAEARREKLTIRKDKSGNVTATNALGADAQSLKLRMPDGTMYTAEKLPMGETCKLTKTRRLQDARLPSVKDFCMKAANWYFGDDAAAIERSYIRLEPGMYQVMLDGHPFVSTAITNPAKDQGKTLVFGRFEVEKK